MPPRGVGKGTKRARQYEHVKESELDRGVPEERAEEIAARTVNKQRSRNGETEASAGRRRDGGSTRDALYEEARRLGIEGRSYMRKAELEKAVAAAR